MVKKKKGNVLPEQTLLSEEDIHAIDTFCDQWDFEEISLDRWGEVHGSLDLLLELPVTRAEAKTGCRKELHFVRTTSCDSSINKATSQKKIRVQRYIDVPPNSKNKDEIVLEDQGDVDRNEKGNLTVVLIVS